jgi:hypothetical protein
MLVFSVRAGCQGSLASRDLESAGLAVCGVCAGDARHLATLERAPAQSAQENAETRIGTSLAPTTTISALQRQERVMSLIKKSSVLAAVFLAMFVGTARAQETVDAKIPFSFVVHGRAFPAGRYALSTDDHNVLMIRSADDRSELFAMVHPATGHDPAGNQPALVFIRFENKYLLSQIWESDTDGLALEKEPDTSKHEADDAQPLPSVVLTFGLEANWK